LKNFFVDEEQNRKERITFESFPFRQNQQILFPLDWDKGVEEAAKAFSSV
jgi:hypothetical protein